MNAAVHEADAIGGFAGIAGRQWAHYNVKRDTLDV